MKHQKTKSISTFPFSNARLIGHTQWIWKRHFRTRKVSTFKKKKRKQDWKIKVNSTRRTRIHLETRLGWKYTRGKGFRPFLRVVISWRKSVMNVSIVSPSSRRKPTSTAWRPHTSWKFQDGRRLLICCSERKSSTRRYALSRILSKPSSTRRE